MWLAVTCAVRLVFVFVGAKEVVVLCVVAFVAFVAFDRVARQEASVSDVS